MLTRLAPVALLLPLLAPAAHPAACTLTDPDGPRTLVLALDGVPYRVAVEARERGAFADWPAPVELVSTFPSVTNVAFTALFRPFDVAPAGGYEVRHYDREVNRVVGGNLVGYGDRLFPWRDTFDVTGRTVRGKLALYTRPMKHSRRQLREAVLAVHDSPSDLVLAHVGATDALQHLRGDEAVTRFLLEVDEVLTRLRADHLRERGRPLRVVVLSDHGNTDRKVRRVKGVRKSLRRAGLRPVAQLKRPRDVVAKTFGVVSYGALYVEPEHAGTAARAVAALPGIDIAAWSAGDGEIRVASGDGEASVLSRERNGHLRYAYRPIEGDPLRFAEVTQRLREAGALDEDGFATPLAWLRASATADFPDALQRLDQALDTVHLRNPAAVIFSTRPGHAWGLRSAHLSSRLAGGRLEGTHGGLDRASSLAFLISDDPRLAGGGVSDLEGALATFAELGRCVHREHASAADRDDP